VFAARLDPAAAVAATVHAYDARGRKTSSTDRLGEITRWTYDPAGNLLSLTDAENQTTAYAYDAAVRKLQETSRFVR
jgi:YD repeat-containing protein